jgi:hypothetical protein
MTLKTTIEIDHDLVIKQEIPFSTELVSVVIKAENIQEFLTTLSQRIQDAASTISD